MPHKPESFVALGAMSGTSLDGVDAAVLTTDGQSIQGFGRSGYRAYTDTERATLSAALGLWDGNDVARAGQVVDRAHLELLRDFPEAEVVGFHGQTLAHEPRGRGTLQVGDGNALAQSLGKTVVWDFRSADVNSGGEGAPLAPFFHHACARFISAKEPVAFLNLGGVGNITWVNPMIADPVDALLAFDTGPANAPLNDLMQKRLCLPFDKGGALARTGRVQQSVVQAFLEEPFFKRIPPKSLDRNDFAEVLQKVDALNDADAAATLLAICTAGVVDAMKHVPTLPSEVLVTGGGRHNPVLMDFLSAALACPVRPVEAVGLDGDMLEAQAFAYLAVRVKLGLPTSCPKTTGVPQPIGGGTVSLPT